MPFPVVYMGRHPKGKDMLSRAFFAAGSLCRGIGSALDDFGVLIMGPQAVHHTRECPPPRSAPVRRHRQHASAADMLPRL
jgi:hypothetical protein